MSAINVRIGQVVAVQSPYGDGSYSFGWRVQRITPKAGRIVIEHESRKADGTPLLRTFDASGRELGRTHSRYHARLEPDAQKARDIEEQRVRQQKAATALARVQTNPNAGRCWSKESMAREVARLEGLLAEAKAAVEAI